MSAATPEQDENDSQPPCHCSGEFTFDRHCGAQVCDKCGKHDGLARCYCGWSESGGDGYAELREMGEQIEPEE